MNDLEKQLGTKVSSGGHTPQSIENDVGECMPYIDLVLEKKVLREFDKWLLPQMMLLVPVQNLDRGNIGNARVFGFEEGLGRHGNQFNNISTVFYATYVVFEGPWVMAVKRFGANNVLALAFISWSIVTLGTGFIHDYGQAIFMRLLLGAAEAGLVPVLSFVQSTIWYRSSQAKRVSLLYMSICLSGAFGGLVAYGIQSMCKQPELRHMTTVL
ncbi:major facilitator superfamily domain-containing protein [Clohesyomyces aquaticus]|uniref:Major facilitator superfamily domain-containing protein n=1 Tax=Clohesyomyces aquaticus TaxID=1231657 RepID=A0A1Y2A962_9PLEO|nr:major facilitator superfamily domain-containing protein [Clohesyomyces aquaticus]